MSLLLAAAADPQSTREIEKVADQFQLAEHSRDMEWLDRHTAPDFIWITRTGAFVNKQEFLRRIREGAVLLQQPGIRAERERQDIRIYGNTAVITRITRREIPDSGTIRFAGTDVWVKTQAGWQMVSSHSNAIPTADPVKP